MSKDKLESASCTPRYGIAEFFGKDFTRLAQAQMRVLAKADNRKQRCPFRLGGGPCAKAGGVCSMRLYERLDDNVRPVADSAIVTMCPHRFYDAGVVTAWVGDTLLKEEAPLILPELPFLLAVGESTGRRPRAVGKIDMVLVHPDTDVLRWCALEAQAVYFSGTGMSSEFNALRSWRGPGLPFPRFVRRPDFRSSGPKRLMPQLQTKVPTLSRWGKKMAVIVDLPFWEALAPMQEERHISNCDVAWFVVDYTDTGERYCVTRHSLHLTTLERAVEGLTSGTAVSKDAFEKALLAKLNKK